MDLLENELVLKYFGCRVLCSEAHFTNMAYDEHERCISTRVLQSMQEPIKKGERFINCHGPNGNGQTSESVNETGQWYGYQEPWHPYYLRLPDRFQKQECVHCFCRIKRKCCYCEEAKPSPEKER